MPRAQARSAAGSERAGAAGGHRVSWLAGWVAGVVTARPATSGKAGRPSWVLRVAAGGDLVHLGELVPGAGEADLQSLGLAEPAGRFGLSDAGGQVAADLSEAGTLGGVGAQQRAAQAGVLVDARGVVGAAAVAEGDLAALEVAEEIGPFLIGRGPVLPGRAQCPAAGDERPVAVDDLFGVDRLISHGGIDVAVAGHQLGDVRRHPVHDRVGDEDPPEVVEGVAQRVAAGVFDPDRGQRVVEVFPQRRLADGPVLQPAPPLEQQRHRRVVDALVLVVGHHQRHVRRWCRGSGDMMVDSTSASSGDTTRSRSSSVLDGVICSSGISSPVPGSRYWIRL